MNCSQTRSELSEWLYDALTPDAAAQVEAHVAACAECRREVEALRQVRQALDLVPTVTAEVDLSRLYRAAAQGQERRLRRWRRVAVALGGLAAALVFFALLPSMEIRCEGHQVVVRWGSPPPLPSPEPPSLPEPVIGPTQFVSTTSPDVDEQLRLLSDIVQRLSTDIQDRDTRQQRDLLSLRTQLTDLREQSRQWRLSTERDVAALYSVQFSELKKGKQP